MTDDQAERIAVALERLAEAIETANKPPPRPKVPDMSGMAPIVVRGRRRGLY